MKELTTVSETALITLKARAVESEKQSPLLHDPQCLELIHTLRSLELSEGQRRLLDRRPPVTLSSYIALRARKYDAYASEFIKNHPSGIIVSLGAGFDTRYWRISAKAGHYFEVELPEMAGLKKEILGDKLEYGLIGCSVLDKAWMEQIAVKQIDNILFLAEGLLMYLPEKEVIQLFSNLASTFSDSRIVFEVVHNKYTKGFRKKIVESKMKRRGGTEAGSAYQFGIADGRDIETYADNLKLMEEWSYFEDPDVRPRSLGLLRHLKSFSRTQWTIHASIG
jgi:methyltransferase (TIGR00027 family)